MQKYSDFIEAILLHEPDLLLELKAREGTLPARVREIRDATPALLAGEKEVADKAMLILVHAGLLYAVDEIGEAHRLVGDASGDSASYWHGMIHRREGDFENARHWYRRTGRHPAFAELHQRGSSLSADVAGQMDWDPYLFTGLCERAAFGEPNDALVALQKMEFEVMFAYVWRQAVSP